MLSAAFVALVTLASCAVAPKTPTNPGEVAQVCGASCRERARCARESATSDDEAACESACEERGSKWRAYWRKDYVDSMSQCLETVACDGAEGEKARRMACVEATRPAPSRKAAEVCSLFIEKLDDCGHLLTKAPYDTNRCLRTIGLLDDSTLDAVGECTKLTCRYWKKYSPWDCIRDVAGADTLP